MARRLLACTTHLAVLLAVLLAAATTVLTPSPAAAVVNGELAVTVTGPVGARLDGHLTLYAFNAAGTRVDYVDARRLATVATPVTYTFSVPPGAYYLSFRDRGTDYYDTWSAGALEEPATPTSPGVVTVASGGPSTTTVPVQAVGPRQTLTGRVVDDAGLGVPSSVRARQTDGRGSGAVATRGDGTFTLQLPVGTYELTIEPEEEHRYAATVRAITVAVGVTRLGDVPVGPVGTASVSGTVRRADGVASAGSAVELLRCSLDDEGAETGTGAVDPCVTIARTTASDVGTYAFAGVPGSLDYTVAARDAEHRRTLLGDVATSVEATWFEVDGDVTDADLRLREGSVLRGVVTSVSGAPAPGVEVEVVRWDDAAGRFVPHTTRTTGTDGGYRAGVPDAGRYAVRLDGHRAGLGSTWLGGSEPTAATGAGATGVVTIGDAVTTTVRDQRLPAPSRVVGRISGVVAGVLTPAAGVAASVHRWSSAQQRWVEVGSAVTDPEGRFAVLAAGRGRYAIDLRAEAASGLDSLWWGGATEAPTGPDASGVLTVAADGVDVTADQTLPGTPARGTVTTTVVDGYGTALPGASVTLLRADAADASGGAGGAGGADGPWTAVPDGSTDLSPANRANPSLAGATGVVGWQVSPGWYRLEATATGCDPATGAPVDLTGPDAPTPVPALVMTCPGRPAPAPYVDPSVAGQVRVGETIEAIGAVWPASLTTTSLTLERDGVPLDRVEYRILPVDLGATFRVVTTAGRGAPYASAQAASDDVTAAPGRAPSPSRAPRVSGTARVGGLLTANPGAWPDSGGEADGVGYRWLRDRTPLTGTLAATPTYRPTPADAGHTISVEVTLRREGYLPAVAQSGAVTIARVPTATTARVTSSAARRAVITVRVRALGVDDPLGAVRLVRVGGGGGRAVLAVTRLSRTGDGVVRVAVRRPARGLTRLVARYQGAAGTAPSTSTPVAVR